MLKPKQIKILEKQFRKHTKEQLEVDLNENETKMKLVVNSSHSPIPTDFKLGNIELTERDYYFLFECYFDLLCQKEKLMVEEMVNKLNK